MTSDHPEQVNPGDSVKVVLVLEPADPSEVDAVPQDDQPWTAGVLKVDYEAKIDGAATACGTQATGSFDIDAQGEVRVELPLMVAYSLSGVQVQTSF